MHLFKFWEKRILGRCIYMLLIAALIAGQALPSFAEGVPDLESEAAILMDAETGQILYEKNSRTKMYPASITKIMTGMLALTCLDPDDEITISQNAFNAVPRSSSHIGLLPGEVITVDQALHALAMASANDAANGLAEAISGSLSDFAELMTAEAEAFGAMDTHFANANGLPDEEHYTTAYDMALITAAALRTKGFTDYFGATEYGMEPTNKTDEDRLIINKNQILNGPYKYDGVLMSKTGWTSSALGTLVTAVRQGNTTFIVVVMKSQPLEAKYEDTCALLNYGFSGFRKMNLTGAEAAEQLFPDTYVPEEGQHFPVHVPADMEPSQITFSVAEGADLLKTDADRLTVTIAASAGEMQLPSMQLRLARKIWEPEPQEETVVADKDGGLVSVIVAGTIAVSSLTGIIWLVWWERSKRRTDQRRLQWRFHLMRKQMAHAEENFEEVTE